jgi:hypothetical protein
MRSYRLAEGDQLRASFVILEGFDVIEVKQGEIGRLGCLPGTVVPAFPKILTRMAKTLIHFKSG